MIFLSLTGGDRGNLHGFLDYEINRRRVIMLIRGMRISDCRVLYLSMWGTSEPRLDEVPPGG
jgi:hypothetical protein